MNRSLCPIENAQYSRGQYRHGDSNPGISPREQDLVRAVALALRDLAEQAQAIYATLALKNGAQLVWDTDDGFTLLPVDGGPLEISEWVDRVDFVAVDGVESVREQPALLARRADA